MDSEAHVKRPMNCFMVWSREKRYHILKEHPGINNAEVSKALGAAWRKLSEEDKEPYVEEARRLTEQHKIENPGYKYQPKRRNSKRIKRRPEKKVIDSSRHYAKIHQRKTTGEKIHFPVKAMIEPQIPVLTKTEGRPLVWLPPNAGNLQCSPPPGFQPSALRFCSCHIFYTAPHYHPAWALESNGTCNHFYNFGRTSWLQSYNVQENSLTDRKVEPFFRDCKLWLLSSLVCFPSESYKSLLKTVSSNWYSNNENKRLIRFVYCFQK